ncbi:MAG: hypothetical protein M1840_007446 [Geoglossum simile]|nr:MAG: hypothetical protein M1840_007446 [Geoglossum simile]
MAAQTATEPRTHNEYTVGWVCALPKEQTAATAMLDQRHADLPKPSNDPNIYTLGSIGKHNIVIACLPKGKIGTSSAATVATQMVSTFQSIKVGLMVGIGGGIPPKVRLGDVVVSTPVGQFPGVVQWDFGKAKQGSNFERTGWLNNPPTSLLAALTKLETEHELTGSRIPEYLDVLKEKWPRLAPKYLRSDSLEDVLFKADYSHISTDYEVTVVTDNGEDEEESCRFCDRTKIVKRRARDMRVHYGLIASGNQVIKDATFRDTLNKDLGSHVLCVEMEAAGLMDNFPCIVIRGICDYGDSHKNKDWQEHAAAVAAAFAKELLEHVQPSDVDGERPVKDILDQVLDTMSGIEANVEIVKSKLDRNEDLEILNWLTPIDYGPQQSDFIKRRQKGTGTWLLHTTEFNTWLNQRNKALYCSGIPGAGKTILTSIVIDHLCSKYRTDFSVGIAYLYCNFRQQHQQKPEDLLSSLLKQLVQKQASMPESVEKLYKRHNRERTRPSPNEILEALESVAPQYSRVFIIVDALDECSVSDSERQKFLSAIFNLQAKTGANIFATSRINDNIAKLFGVALSLQIHAKDEDIESYLDGRMPLLQSDILDDALRGMIRREVIRAVDGMFLLAQLHMNTLMDQPTKGDIKQALQHLAKGIDGLDETYKQAMERIEGTGSRVQELAKYILAWIIHAKRPLSTAELQHALAARPRTKNLDIDYLPSVRVLLSVCAGLVTIDKRSGIVRLVHYTTQEYFERTWTSWFPNAQMDITNACVTYLSFDVFETGFCQSDEEFEARLRTNVLYDYAARNWGHHAYTASIEEGSIEEDLVLNLLKSRAKVSATSQAMMASRSYSGYSQRVPRQMTGIHVAAYFGLVGMIIGLLKNGYNPDLQDSYSQTPLSWVAMGGNEAVVKLLLAKDGVDINSRDSRGRTPLSLAAMGGREAVVKLLLAKDGVDINSKDSFSRTPLSLAAEGGHEAVVKLLLAKDGVDINSKNSWGSRTPLSWAAMGGHRAVVKLLLAKDGVDINSKDSRGQTPLSLAAMGGREVVVKLLLAKDGVDINSKDSRGRTPLSLAAMGGREVVVKLLLAKDGVDINSKDSFIRTPLSLAAMGGHEAVVKLLLAKDGVDINSKDSFSRTPLLLAAIGGHEAVVKLLLAKDGVDTNSKDSFSQTPLLLAAEGGHEAVVKLLLAKDGVGINSKDSDCSRTPLSWAAMGGYEAVVKLLLAKDGIDINSRDSRGRTPLLLGAIRRHEAVVKLLLAKDGVDINSKDSDYSQTPLSLAAEGGHEAVVKLLLAKDGVDINSKDFRGRTPLSLAAMGGREVVVKLLLAKDGVDINSKDSSSQTPLSLAAMGGYEAVVKLLLARDGVDINSKDSWGCLTPLSWAAMGGHRGVIKLLQSHSVLSS